MQRLVLKFVVSDDCTYGVDTALPFEHDSPASAACELYDEIQKFECLTKTFPDEFVFCWHTLRRSDFYRYDHTAKKTVMVPPEILTLDQWYEQPRY